MTTALIVGGLLLVGVGLVASQLFRLKDWLNRQPPPTPDDQDQPPIIAAPQVMPQDLQVSEQAPVYQMQENTSPMFPPRVQEPDIENQARPEMGNITPEPDAGINVGIEAGV